MAKNIFGNRNITRMQAIDTEDVGEMTVYANVDDINSHCVHRGTEDTTRHQTSQHTGSECVRIRSHRSVLVCSVVLCVLLLTAVIVLCVLIYTNNHQFNINNKNITQERDQLLTKYTNITEKRNQLLTKYSKLTKERDQLLTNNIKLTDQTNHVIIKYNNLATENKELPTNNNNLIKTKDQITQQINGVLETLKPDGWIYNQSSFYFVSSEEKNWSESRRYCRERKADLIIINNKEEQEFFKKISGSEYHWIGVFYADVQGRWKWVDGSTLTSSSWGYGEPNDQGNKKCVVSYIAQLYAYSCSNAMKWICQRKLF